LKSKSEISRSATSPFSARTESSCRKYFASECSVARQTTSSFPSGPRSVTEISDRETCGSPAIRNALAGTGVGALSVKSSTDTGRFAPRNRFVSVDGLIVSSAIVHVAAIDSLLSVSSRAGPMSGVAATPSAKRRIRSRNARRETIKASWPAIQLAS
jgi:hypothetical protein